MSESWPPGVRAISGLFAALGLAGLALGVWGFLTEALFLPRFIGSFPNELVFLGLAGVALMAAVALEVYAGLRKLRGHRAVLYPALALVLLAPIGGQRLGELAQRRVLARVRQRGEPVLAALSHYRDEHGHWPDDLTALVPKYLAAPPSLGLHGNAQFSYLRDDGHPRDPIEGDPAIECGPWDDRYERHPDRFWLFVSRRDLLCNDLYGYASDARRWKHL